MSLLKTAYCKHLRRNSKGKCSPFEVGVLCLTMALIPLGVVTIQNVLFHAFTYICELETSVPQVASQVATLLHTYTLHLSSSHYFSVHRLWRLNFLLFRHRQVATHVSSFHFITSFLWAPPVATQCSVLLKTLCVSVRVSGSLWASLGLSVRLCAPLRLSGLLWASLGLSGPHWAFAGLSGPPWASLTKTKQFITNIHMYSWRPSFPWGPKYTICPRQLEPLCPSRPEIARQKDQTIPDSCSPSVPPGLKLPDNKTRQYIPGSWSPSVFRGFLGLSQPASQPRSQPAKRMTGLFYQSWASLGPSM